MKPKGINVFEQHVEKIVMGIAALIVVLLGARQMLPGMISVDGREVRTSRVDEELAKRAVLLRGRLDEDRGLDYAAPDRAPDWFEAEHDRPVKPQVSSWGVAFVRPETVRVGEQEFGGRGARTLYAAFIPAAPTKLRVTTRNYSLDPEELVRVPELADRFEEDPPFDLAAVHIRASIDGKQLHESLMAHRDDRRMIPTAWYEHDMSLIDIRVERRKRLSADTWGEIELVQAIPGQETMRDRVAGLRERDLNDFLNDVFALDETIYQPPFYTLFNGEPWTIALLKEAEPLSPKMALAVALMQRDWDRVESAQAQLDRYLEKLAQQSGTRRGRGPGENTGGKGGGIEGGGERGGAPDRSRAQDAQNRRQEDLQRRIDAAMDAYLASKDAVLDLDEDYNKKFPDEEQVRTGGRTGKGTGGLRSPKGGGGEYGEGPGIGMEGSAPPPRRRSKGEGGRAPTPQDEATFFEADDLEIWAHDINVVPGATYRYRVTIDYYNPFFGRLSRLDEEQKHLADSIAWASASSEWSDPLRVTPARQFFVIDGNGRGSIDERSALIEVYLFAGGEYRMTTMSVKPGDPLGERRRIEVPRSQTEDDPDDGGRRPRSGRSGEVDPDQGNGMERIEVDFFTGAVLLDVIQESGGTFDKRVTIVVGLEDGTIVTLDPDQQRTNDERLRLRELAKRAMAKAKP